jgi:hypothetical protein
VRVPPPILPTLGSTGPVPSPSDAAGLSDTQIVQARRGADILVNRDSAQTDRHAAPPPAVPALHVRTCNAQRPDRPHFAPVPAVHVEARSPPAVAINGAQGLSPDRSSRRTSTCGAGAARAHMQSPTPGAGSHAPVPAVHVEVLPPPAIAIESS